jgi:hypothetical protein
MAMAFHAHADEHIGENDSGAVLDGHGGRTRSVSNASVRSVERIASPVHASATPCHEEIDGLRCCLGPKTGLGHVFACVLWIVVIHLLWGGMPSSAASCLPQRHLSGGHG